MLSGEAYVYDKSGRRSLTVNDKGLVTVYKYDNQSRLETVFYPFNEDIKETARKEADKQGLYFLPSQGNAENYFLSSGELMQVRAAAEYIAGGRSGAVTVNQVVWKESYTYDANGNRTSKTTAWGTVEYSYDKENRLVESGNLGMSESVKYTYDANGNLLRESAARYRKDYTYNAQNRMSFSDVQDSVLNTRNFTEYAYDAFGRRIETKEYLGDYTRNLYDGFSFDVLSKSVLQSAYSANIPEQMYRTPSTQRHPELVSGSTSNGRNERGTEIGTRYRYIDDTPLVPMTEAEKANGTNAASSASGAKMRSRPNNEYVLYSYGEPVAMSADGNASYFDTDILGSVRSVTDKYGTVQADYSYDAFGSPYLGNLENDVGFGYCGKSYDVGTGLYDYGFRDYSPNNARFTTIDPIRDGSNWFAYVVNDPVNYVDPLGLTASDRGGSSLNFNSGMFGQNVGFNGFTFNSSVQTNNSRQTGISYQNSNTSTISAYSAPFNYGKGKYGSLPTFAGLNSGNNTLDFIVNTFVGSYNFVAGLINTWDNGIGAWRELFAYAQETIDNAFIQAIGMDPAQLIFELSNWGLLGQTVLAFNDFRTWTVLSKAANVDCKFPSAKGLIGHDFEDYLTKEIGGNGSFSIGGREFDGGIGNRWWEAKSGQYWNMLESNPKAMNNFKSSMGQRLTIASENNATYELFSNTPIPDSIKLWLTNKGISYTEILY